MDTYTSAKKVAAAFIVKEERIAIKVLTPKKAPGYDLITNEVLQKLPEEEIRFHPTL